MYYRLAALASFLLSLFFWRSYSGPYRLVADLQSSVWRVDYVIMSLPACWAMLYVPLHLVVGRIERHFGEPREPVIWRRLVALLAFLFGERPGQVAGIGAVLLGLGGWLWVKTATSGPLTTFTVLQAQRGESPPSRYVRMPDAEIRWSRELTFKDNNWVHRYYPVTSKQSASDRFRVFVEIEGPQSIEELVGELEFDGLPGPLRAQLADQELLAPGYFVIRYHRDPTEGGALGVTMAGAGTILCACGLFWAWSRRRIAKSADRSAPVRRA
jgi:hypothetical protein